MEYVRIERRVSMKGIKGCCSGPQNLKHFLYRETSTKTKVGVEFSGTADLKSCRLKTCAGDEGLGRKQGEERADGLKGEKENKKQ